ncbi:MAG TPA: hypothetical protein PLM24_01445 [Methanothrix sp.]|nr:hypothetical protein [Methanothrix sp.]HPJ84450.1 hypothetical protein [Methanothrix sp.]HPR65782.1 hypothetical protein [Methanothrix sp.]
MGLEPLVFWHLPCIFMSSVGILDQPGYWPPGYILASRVFLVLLMSFLGFKAVFWPFRFVEDE